MTMSMILLFLLFILVISVLCETVIEEQENMNIVNETLYTNKRLTEKDDLRRKRKQRDREKENLITAQKTVVLKHTYILISVEL